MTSSLPWFIRAVYVARKYFFWLLPKKKVSKHREHALHTEYDPLITFTGLDIEPQDIILVSYMSGLISFLVFFLIDVLIIVFSGARLDRLDMVTVAFMILLVLVFPLIIINLIARYPKTYAAYHKIRSLGDIPEVMSYLVMYLKVVPNLENSVKFAAMESTTTLSQDLRKLLWDLEIRLYHGIDDALVAFALQWGEWSDYVKRSLHLIRASIQERSETTRLLTLDRALEVSLDGTKETMTHFANKIQQPTMILFSLGIMIPLSLVAMLPVVGLVGVRISILQIFLFYNIILPFFVFLYIRKILLSRPVTFQPPLIPFHHPDLLKINKKRTGVLSLLFGMLIALPGLLFVIIPFLGENDVSSFFNNVIQMVSFLPSTLFFLWGITAAITIYCVTVYAPYKKIRDAIKQIEREFSDALYILGKRIAEERSPEEGFLHTARTLEGTRISEVFEQTSYNLLAHHASLKHALFSEEYGSLRYIYSNRVKAIFRLFIEGVQKSQQVVGLSLIRIADHLKQLQDIEKKMADMLFEMTSTLRSTATVFAPLIAGVTLAITSLISNILGVLRGNMESYESLTTLSGGLTSVTGAFSAQSVAPELFILVIGLYLIELNILLTRFSNGLNEGDDKALYLYSLGKTLPVSIGIFSVTVIVGQMLFSGFLQSM